MHSLAKLQSYIMAKPSILAARTPTISADQKGPVVDLVSWIAMTTMCLAVITVLVSKLVVLRKLVWRDGILVAAMVSHIATVRLKCMQVHIFES